MHVPSNEWAPTAPAEKSESLFWLTIGLISLGFTLYFSIQFSQYEIAALALTGVFFGAWPHLLSRLIYPAGVISLFSLGRSLFISGHFFWTLGLLLSVICGWMILVLAAEWILSWESAPPAPSEELLAEKEALELLVEEKNKELERLEKEGETALQAAAQENRNLRIEQDSFKKEYYSLEKRMSKESQEILFLRQEKETLETELLRARNEEGLKLQNEELFRDLNTARSNEAQTKLINQTIARLYASEKQTNEQLHREIETLAQPQPAIPSDMAQLRKQFEERRQVLHEVRSELFHTETQLQTLQREAQAPPYDAGQDLIFSEVEEAFSRLETENQLLQEIINATCAALPKPETPSAEG